MPALYELHFSSGVVLSVNKKTHQLLQGRGRGCALYQRVPGLNGFVCSPTAFLEFKTCFEHTLLVYLPGSKVWPLIVQQFDLFAFGAFWIKAFYPLFHAWAENLDLICTESLWLICRDNYTWNTDVREGTPWDCKESLPWKAKGVRSSVRARMVDFSFFITFWLALVAVRMQRSTVLLRNYLHEDKLMYIATARNENLGRAMKKMMIGI